MHLSRHLARQASMRPARKGPENGQIGQQQIGRVQASMRPARKGPENVAGEVQCSQQNAGFNEAGPQGAGKRRSPARASTVTAPASMRPARKGPENPLEARFPAGGDPASMRPARKGPENFSLIHSSALAIGLQ